MTTGQTGDRSFNLIDALVRTQQATQAAAPVVSGFTRFLSVEEILELDDQGFVLDADTGPYLWGTAIWGFSIWA